MSSRKLGSRSVLRVLRDATRMLLAVGLVGIVLAGCSGGGGSGAGAPTGGTAGTGGTGSGAGGGAGAGGGGGGNGQGGGSGAPSVGLRPVVYVADQDVYDRFELYMSSPTVPGASIKLNPPLPSGGNVDSFAVTPSGQSVVYVADQEVDNLYEVFIVHLAEPGTAIKLNAPLGADRDVQDFALSPDGTKVVYRADHDTHDVWELYLVDVASPGSAGKVNGALVPGGWVRGGYLIDPTGMHVAYRADEDVKDVVELYLVDLGVPGVSYRANPPLVAGGNVYEQFKFTPDGAYVGYVADQEVDQKLELFAVHVATPGTSSKLNGPMIADGDVCTFAFSPDSQHAAYCADQETDGVLELYAASLSAPGASTKLNPPLVPDGKVTHRYAFGADSSFVAYVALQDSAEHAELYRVDLASPGAATKLSDSLVPGGDVEHFAFSPDGARVAYAANQDDPYVVEIYEVDLGSPGASVKVSGPMPDVGVYEFAYEDDTSIVYTATETGDTDELYRVDLSAPGVSTRLNGELVDGGFVWAFAIVP